MQHKVVATQQEQLDVEPYWELDASVSYVSHEQRVGQICSTNNELFSDKYRYHARGADLLYCEEKAEI